MDVVTGLKGGLGPLMRGHFGTMLGDMREGAPPFSGHNVLFAYTCHGQKSEARSLTLSACTCSAQKSEGTTPYIA